MRLQDIINWHKEMERVAANKKEENDLQQFIDDETPLFVGIDENGEIIYSFEQNGASNGSQEN